MILNFIEELISSFNMLIAIIFFYKKMKIVIFFEVIISFEIIWNLIFRMDGDKLGFIVSAVVLHYINFLIKCILINLESQKW